MVYYFVKHRFSSSATASVIQNAMDLSDFRPLLLHRQTSFHAIPRLERQQQTLRYEHPPTWGTDRKLPCKAQITPRKCGSVTLFVIR